MSCVCVSYGYELKCGLSSSIPLWRGMLWLWLWLGLVVDRLLLLLLELLSFVVLQQKTSTVPTLVMHCQQVAPQTPGRHAPFHASPLVGFHASLLPRPAQCEGRSVFFPFVCCNFLCVDCKISACFFFLREVLRLHPLPFILPSAHTHFPHSFWRHAAIRRCFFLPTLTLTPDSYFAVQLECLARCLTFRVVAKRGRE